MLFTTRLRRHSSGLTTLVALDEIEALHVGSTTLINEPAAAEYLKMFRDAKSRTTLSFDPNCRPSLICDKAKYLARMAEFSCHCRYCPHVGPGFRLSLRRG